MYFFFTTVNVVHTSHENAHKLFRRDDIFHPRKETIPNNVILYNINSGQNGNIAFSSRTSVVVVVRTASPICTIARPGRFDLPKCILCDVWEDNEITHIPTRVYDDILCTRSRVVYAVDDQQPAVDAARDSRSPSKTTRHHLYAKLDVTYINI